jgi:TetR/AcrR family transcriptional regulator of autoinduction and epiphytic fitness
MLDAAQRAFLRDGFHATTMERIAEDAGVSRQTLYNYFSDKEQIFVALIQERKVEQSRALVRRMFEILARGDAAAGLEEATRMLLTHGADGDSVALFRLIMDVAEEMPDLIARVRVQVIEHGIAALHGALRRGIESGTLRPVDPEVVAHLIFAAATGYGIVHPILLGEHRLPPDRVAAGLADLLRHGLAAVPPPAIPAPEGL